ncbi:hypothetical protein [uncultured Ferrovibrio sp.]|uniref:hypothetical protein n=1 Tax=uncultured Ferrovibrio sp. TaxID=1576913 RepID=UPI00260CA8B5|nr:hypothetical protein [uncultured Ferrovibrio sp.]
MVGRLANDFSRDAAWLNSIGCPDAEIGVIAAWINRFYGAAGERDGTAELDCALLPQAKNT